MSEVKASELRVVRVEVAVRLCLMYPNLFWKVTSKKPQYINPKERLAAKLLVYLMKLEPSVKHVLSFYYKREGR